MQREMSAPTATRARNADASGYSLYGGDSENMSIGSLDEDSERLLNDARHAQIQARDEISKARHALERTSPLTSPRTPVTSLSSAPRYNDKTS